MFNTYKYFYFSKYIFGACFALTIRRNGKIDPAAYEQWKSKTAESALDNGERTPDPSRPWFEQIPSRDVPVGTAPHSENEPKGPSFEEIAEFISTGKPVPGIRQIPDQLSVETPSISSNAVPPKKPWEKIVSE